MTYMYTREDIVAGIDAANIGLLQSVINRSNLEVSELLSGISAALLAEEL